jgi:hypothetical protein
VFHYFHLQRFSTPPFGSTLLVRIANAQSCATAVPCARVDSSGKSGSAASVGGRIKRLWRPRFFIGPYLPSHMHARAIRGRAESDLLLHNLAYQAALTLS